MQILVLSGQILIKVQQKIQGFTPNRLATINIFVKCVKISFSSFYIQLYSFSIKLYKKCFDLYEIFTVAWRHTQEPAGKKIMQKFEKLYVAARAFFLQLIMWKCISHRFSTIKKTSLFTLKLLSFTNELEEFNNFYTQTCS